MKIELEKLKKKIESCSYKSNGAQPEQEFDYVVKELFPNSEIFWKKFIVPFTNRIDETITHESLAIHPRTEISKDLREIGSFHYSIFHNLVYAYLAFERKHASHFENFYTHLGSVCDSVEEFLLKLYLLNLECNNIKSKILEKLPKNEFLQIASQWYDENYEKVYEHYLNNGKPPPLRIPMRTSVLEEYFGKSKDWKEYKKFSQKIREYRNVIVHNYQIAFIQDQHGTHHVPKKEKIRNYKRWNDVFTGAADPKKFHDDFIIREVQMIQDLQNMMLVLQELWKKPITDMDNLFLIGKNEILLSKYCLTLI
jgi:hypothetical protein